MEKLPSFERPAPRVVGPVSPEKRAAFSRRILENFGRKHYKQFPKEGKALKAAEYGKTPMEKRFIARANEFTNKLLVEAGLNPFDIPERNIHIVPKEAYKEVGDPDDPGITRADKQAVFLNAEYVRGNKLIAAAIMLHEIIHTKEYLAVQISEEDNDPYRGGLQITSTFKKDERLGGGYSAFRGLNEAVDEELEYRGIPEIIQDSKMLVKEWRWLQTDEARALKEKIAHDKKIDADRILWISRDGSDYLLRPYHGSRKMLGAITKAIYEDNQETFKTEDDVARVFFRAHFDGKILALARLIEKSFGEGSFRIIGAVRTENPSGFMTLDTLLKKRRLLKKQT